MTKHTRRRKQTSLLPELDKPFTAQYIKSPDFDKNLAVIRAAMTPMKEHLTPDKVEEMAATGMSQWTICSLFECQFSTISDTPDLLAAFNKGRAQVGQRIRSELVKDALENNIVPVKLYLDKIYSKEDDTKKVELSVSERPLENVPTEQLLEIDFEDSDEQG
jgi:hypothetical protein